MPSGPRSMILSVIALPGFVCPSWFWGQRARKRTPPGPYVTPPSLYAASATRTAVPGEAGDVAGAVADDADLVQRAVRAVRHAADQQPVRRALLQRQAAEAGRHPGRRADVGDRVRAVERRRQHELLRRRGRTGERHGGKRDRQRDDTHAGHTLPQAPVSCQPGLAGRMGGQPAKSRSAERPPVAIGSPCASSSASNSTSSHRRRNAARSPCLIAAGSSPSSQSGTNAEPPVAAADHARRRTRARRRRRRPGAARSPPA